MTTETETKTVAELDPGDRLTFTSVSTGKATTYTVDRVEPAPDFLGDEMVRVHFRERNVASCETRADQETTCEPVRACFLCERELDPDDPHDVCPSCWPEDEARNRAIEAAENRHEL